jgi:uncharacterized Fe-S center protein
MTWDREACRGCFAHRSVVSCGALVNPADWGELNPVAIADAAFGAAKAIGHDRVGYLNLAVDVVPLCDCIPYADRPMVPNIGVFASKDPVAIDLACVEAVNNAPGIPGSVAETKGVAERGVVKHDKCSSIQGSSQYLQIKAAQKLGMGTMDYDLVELERVPSIQPFVQNPAGGAPRAIGSRYSNAFKKFPFFPEGGFPRVNDTDVTDLR